jgi:NAD(P)H-hydrate repair Nnr-like enzyme with NAD(P)H-hydrate dehydratase domain
MQKQTNQPLFPNVLWEKPLNRRAAKKLLIIGGHASQFSATASTYQSALAAGIGEAKVVLPAPLRKLTGGLADALFVPATPAGSIAKAAYPEIKSYITESDGVLLAGELSSNAETVSVLEQLLTDTTSPLIICGDVIDSLLALTSAIFKHPTRLLIGNSRTLVNLAGKLNIPMTIKPEAGVVNKVNLLSALEAEQGASWVLHGPELIIAAGGKCSVTTYHSSDKLPLDHLPGIFSTFWLQHPQAYDALTTAAFIAAQAGTLEAVPKLIDR